MPCKCQTWKVQQTGTKLLEQDTKEASEEKQDTPLPDSGISPPGRAKVKFFFSLLTENQADEDDGTNRLLVELLLVESELLTLEDVSVAAAGLAGTAGDDGEEATGLELLLDWVLDLALGGKALGLLLLDRLGALDLLLLDALSLLATAADGLAVVGLVPLAEGGGVDLDDGAAGQGVGADQLVVGRVVGDGDDARLAGAALGGPGKVTRVEAQGAVLVVAAAGADGVDTLGADTGVGTLAASLESALLPYCQRSERMFSSKWNIRAFGKMREARSTTKLVVCCALRCYAGEQHRRPAAVLFLDPSSKIYIRFIVCYKDQYAR